MSTSRIWMARRCSDTAARMAAFASSHRWHSLRVYSVTSVAMTLSLVHQLLRLELAQQRGHVRFERGARDVVLVRQSIDDLFDGRTIGQQLPHARADRIESVVDAAVVVEQHHLAADHLGDDALARLHAADVTAAMTSHSSPRRAMSSLGQAAKSGTRSTSAETRSSSATRMCGSRWSAIELFATSCIAASCPPSGATRGLPATRPRSTTTAP